MKPFPGAILVVALGGCGYEPVYGGAPPTQRLTVTAAPHQTAHMDAVRSAVAGMRHGLAEAGVLRAGTAHPMAVVEVLRVDEKPTAVHRGSGPGGEPTPLGRGSAVGVVGRAWVIEGLGAQRSRDTGDLRRVEHYATGSDSVSERRSYDDAVAAASRSVGRSLAARLLGEPKALLEPM